MYLLIHDSPMTDGYTNWLMGEMAKLGIKSADCGVLNLTLHKVKKAGLAPTAAHIKENAPEFYAALAASSARVVIPFGPHASRGILGRKDGIDSLRGYIFTAEDTGVVARKEQQEIGIYKSGVRKGEVKLKNITISEKPSLPVNAIVIPTYSVAYIITKGKKPFYVLAQDLKRAKAAHDGTLKMDDAGFTYTTQPVLGWIPKDGKFAFDIETASLGNGEYSREPRSYAGISLSDGETSMSLDWCDATREYVNQYLSDPRLVKYAHNSNFDVARLRDAGSPVAEPIIDTMSLGQLLQPDTLKRLESQAPLYLNIKQWKGQSESEPYFYSARDAFITMLLANDLEQRIAQVGMYDLSRAVCQCLPVLLAMEEGGLRVDVPRAQAWAADLKERLTILLAEWFQKYTSCSPTSPKQLHKYLYGTLGMIPQKNKSDGDTTGAEALFNLRLLYPQHAEMLTLLGDIRDLNKQHGTYAKSLAGLFAKGLDRIHPRYMAGGSEGESFGRKASASTGRLGASNPNPQNQTPESRLMYIPDSDTDVFVEFDYTSAELYVIAFLSQDKNLQAALRDNIHQRTADKLGISRPLAKNVMYASCYLGGAKTIQSMMKKHGVLVPLEEIKSAQAALKREYPKMAAWQIATVAEGTSKGYLINPMGRVRFFYGGQNDAPEIADFDPQSTIADIALRVMPDLHREAKALRGRLAMHGHDSFLIQLPADKMRHIYVFKEILEQEFNEIAPGFRIPVAIKYGAPGGSWGSLSEEKVNV